jgi:hypothetical protein
MYVSALLMKQYLPLIALVGTRFPYDVYNSCYSINHTVSQFDTLFTAIPLDALPAH